MRRRRTQRLASIQALEARIVLDASLHPTSFDNVFYTTQYDGGVPIAGPLALFSAARPVSDTSHYGAMAAGFSDRQRGEPEFGLNHAILEFDVSQLTSASQATLELANILIPGDFVEASHFSISGFVSNGVITTADYNRSATAINHLSGGGTKGFTVDVTDFLNKALASKPGHIGFRIEATDDGSWAIFGNQASQMTLKVVSPTIVSVTPQYGKPISAGVYGSYLSGVKLTEVFTVAVSQKTGFTAINYSIAGGTSGAATQVAGTNIWKFSTDVGLIANGSKVRVNMLNGTKTISSKEITLAVIDSLKLDVAARGASESTDYNTLASVRLIDGVPMDLDFQSTISGATLLPIYNERLALQVYQRGSVKVIHDDGMSFSEGVSHLPFTASDFPDFKTDTSNDYDFFVVAGKNFRDKLVKFNATPPELFVTKLPSWMGTPVHEEFRPLTGADPAYNHTGNVYAIEISVPALKKDYGTTEGTPFGLLDDLETYIDVGATLVLYARLNSSPDAILQAKEMHATAMLLDNPILKHSRNLQDGSITVSGKLDGKLLLGKTIVIKTPVIDLLKDLPGHTLINREFSLINVPTPIPLVTGTLNVGLRIDVNQLDAEFSLGIDIAGTTPKLDQETTFVRVETKIDALVSGTGSLSLVKLATLTVGAAVRVNLHANLQANFSGSFFSPKVSTDKTTASLHVGIVTAWDLAVLNQNTSIMEKLHQKAVTAEKWEEADTSPIFGVAPTTQSLENAIPAGPVGFKDQNPLIGDALSDVVPTGAARTFRAATPIPAPPITASLTLPGVIEDNTRSFTYEAKVDADHQHLTGGKHFLKVILTDTVTRKETVVDNWDLGKLSPATVDSVLGFTTGFLKRTITIPPTALTFGSFYTLRLQYDSDRTATGETVAAELRNAALQSGPPKIAVTSQFGSVTDGRLDFGKDSSSQSRAFIYITNTGTTPLSVAAMTVSAGFRIGYNINLPGSILPGASLAVPVDVIDPTKAATGKLTIASNDPMKPLFELSLKSSGGLAALGPIALVGDNLIITGTGNNDTVVLHQGTIAGTVFVTFNGVSSVPIAAPTRVIANLGKGNDSFIADSTITTPLQLFGGPGNDSITGGAGNDQLFGGDGVDALKGGGGTNLLVSDSAPPKVFVATTAAYKENGTPTILTPAATLTDADTRLFSDGTLTIRIKSGAQATDQLRIRSQGTGANQFSLSGHSILFGGIVMGTFSGGDGTSPLTILLNSTASTAATQLLIRDITFASTGDSPRAGAHIIEYILKDGDGGISVPVTTTVTVTTINDAPTGAPKSITVQRGGSYVFNRADFGFSDAKDNSVNTLRAVRIATVPGVGTLWNGTTKVVSGAFVSVADIDAKKLVYRPVSRNFGTPYASFAFQVQDNGGTANGGIDLDQTPRKLTINVK